MIPDWYRTGWREVSGIDVQHPPEGEEKDKFVLQAFIGEQYYGEWYHNAAIIIVVRSSILPVEQLLIQCSVRRSVAFHDPLRSWLGMALRTPRLLQHLLHDVHDARPAEGAGRYSTRAGQDPA